MTEAIAIRYGRTRTSSANILGRVGDGWNVAMTLPCVERVEGVEGVEGATTEIQHNTITEKVLDLTASLAPIPARGPQQSAEALATCQSGRHQPPRPNTARRARWLHRIVCLRGC